MESENKVVGADQPKIAKPKLTPVFTMLESAIKTWWQNLGKFVQMYLWGLVYALIPMAIIALGMIINNWRGGDLMSSFLAVKISFSVLGALAVIAMIYFMLRAYTGIFLLVKNNYQGEILTIFKETKNVVLPYLALAVLTTIFIFLWTLLLIIPGIIFSIFYSLAIYVFFFEGKKGMAAIKRSTELVKNYWWAVAGRYLLFGLIMWVVMMIFSAPLMMVPEKSLPWQILNAIYQIINMLIGPIALLFSYQIYQDLVKIKK